MSGMIMVSADKAHVDLYNRARANFDKLKGTLEPDDFLSLTYVMVLSLEMMEKLHGTEEGADCLKNALTQLADAGFVDYAIRNGLVNSPSGEKGTLQ